MARKLHPSGYGYDVKIMPTDTWTNNLQCIKVNMAGSGEGAGNSLRELTSVTSALN